MAILAEHSVENQTAFLEAFVSSLKFYASSAVNKKNPVPKIICEMNVTTVFYQFLRRLKSLRLTLDGERALTLSQEILQGSLVHISPLLRCVACDTLGILVKSVHDENFSNNVIQALVEQVINNKDPEARSSYGLALACIYRQVGGMAATSHLKTIVSMLHSLASDPNPIVHTWALHALWLTMESAGLMFSTYLSITGSLLQKLLMSDHHDPLHHAALESQFHTGEVYQILGKILYSYLGILGPELATSASTRGQCANFMDYFMKVEDPHVVAQALRCLQQFLLLAPKTIDISNILPLLQTLLLPSSSASIEGQVVKRGCITCIRQLVQREPVTVSTSSQLIEEQLLSLMDYTSEDFHDEIKDVLVGLLKATGTMMPSLWINLTRDCLSRGSGGGTSSGGAGSGVTGAATDTEDESGTESVRSSPSKKTAASPAGNKAISNFVFLQAVRSPFPKWRTQLFVVRLLRTLISLFPRNKVTEHTDMALALSRKKYLEAHKRALASAIDFCVFRVQDLIRLAFNASTHPVDELKMEGLFLLQDVIERFSAGRDPEFEGHSLLEQYQVSGCHYFMGGLIFTYDD